MSESILVLGRNGQVARELAKIGPPAGFEMAFLGRDRFDLSSGADPMVLIEALSPAVVINAAAYTAVDKAESEPEAAFALNRDAPGALARACALGDVPFVHFSTDYVFDGTKPEPYVETDPICPLCVYGESKAEGEAAVIGAGGRTGILRNPRPRSAARPDRRRRRARPGSRPASAWS